MKVISRIGMMLLVACAVRAEAQQPSTGDFERTDQAVREAIAKAQQSLMASPVGAGATIAILPFYNDAGEIVRDRMKNAVTAAGKTCVEEKQSAVLGEILKEIAWDERKEDVLDPATVVRFGRLKGAQYLLYGGVLGRTTTSRYALVELEFHLTEIATKKHVWGGTFASRIYAETPDPTKLIAVTPEVRAEMRGQLRDLMAASLKKNERVAGVKVTSLPIVADDDLYVSGLVRDVLASSALRPVNLDVSTRGEARLALKEHPELGDAVLYGALREMKASLVSVSLFRWRTYEARAEVQLCIEKGATREILWSDTLFASKTFEQPPSKPWLLVVIPLGVLLALIVLFILVRYATRVR